MVVLSTPEANIDAALMARLYTLILSPAFAIAAPGVSFPGIDPATNKEKPKPANFLRVEHGGIAKARPFLSTTSRQRGSFFVSVCMPIGTPNTIATEAAGAVAAHFPADLEITSGGIRVRITEDPTVAGGYSDPADARWRVPVIIPYEVWLQAS